MKVRCIEGKEPKQFKVGSIYELRTEYNGSIKGETGYIYKNINKKTGKNLIEKWNNWYSFWGKFEEVKMFTKDDLKPFDVLVFEKGNRAMVVSVKEEKELSWFSGGGDSIEILSEKGTNNIMRENIIGGKLLKIFRPRTRGDLGYFLKTLDNDVINLIWEREEKSQAQIEIEELKKERDEYNKKMDERLAKLESELS